MTEMMMTAQELAEARELEQAATAGPWDDDGSGFINGPDGGALAQMWNKFEDDFPNAENNRRFIAAARTLVPRLLATVDALTQRREDMDLMDETLQAGEMGLAAIRKLKQERDEALAALNAEKKAHADTARLAEQRLAERNSVQEELDAYAEQLAGALALLAETRRALEPVARCFSDRMERQLGGYTLLIESQQDGYRSHETFQAKVLTGADFRAAWEALSLTAPEALRQQQERESGKDALIEALRGAILRHARHRFNCPFASGMDCECWVDEALSLTPPQALAKQREYVGALERVAEAARVWHESCIDVPPHSDAECEASEEFQDALAALDAAKKGAPDAG